MKISITEKVKPAYLKKYIIQNKKKSILFLLILIGAIYGITKIFAGGATTTTYAVANVTRGDVVTTISASGQVSATNEVELSAAT